MKEDKECFVIAPIGEPDSDIRKRSDQLFKHIIRPVVEQMGYRPIRADHISEPGIITSQVIQHVVDSALVIADLTGRNPNVFYELAVRHALKRPLVQIIKRGEQIPFDVASTRTIGVDVHDLDSVDEAKQELTNQIESIERGKTEIDTPISVALDLKILKESRSPEKRSFASLLEAISGITRGINNMEKRIGSLEYEIGRYSEQQQEALARLSQLPAETQLPRGRKWSELATPTSGRNAKRDEWIEYLAEVKALPVWAEHLQPFPVYFRRLRPEHDIVHIRGLGKKTRKRVAEILGIESKEDCERVREEIEERFGEQI